MVFGVNCGFWGELWLQWFLGCTVVFGVNCGFSGFWGELFFGVNCGFSGFWCELWL